MVGPQPFVREARELPASDLVLVTEPPPQPRRHVPVDGPAGRADLAGAAVFRPAGQQ